MSEDKSTGENEVKEEEQEKVQDEEKVMPFLDHLEELRQRLLMAIISLFVATIGCYFFSRKIIVFLTDPYPDKLIFLAPTESFVVHIKVSLFAGLFLSLPFIFYQLWQFVVPGLFEKERKYVPQVVFFSTFFFISGAAFCYYVIIPFGLKFLLGWQSENLIPNVALKEYLKFVTMLVLVFGLVFELPLLSFFLTKMGLITPQFISKNRRYGIVLTFVLAAILTPPDIVTQLLLAGPLLILYEISILVSKSVYKKPEETNSE